MERESGKTNVWMKIILRISIYQTPLLVAHDITEQTRTFKIRHCKCIIKHSCGHLNLLE